MEIENGYGKWIWKWKSRGVQPAFPLAQHEGHLSAENSECKIESVLVQRRVNQLSLLHFYLVSKNELQIEIEIDIDIEKRKRKARPEGNVI